MQYLQMNPRAKTGRSRGMIASKCNQNGEFQVQGETSEGQSRETPDVNFRPLHAHTRALMPTRTQYPMFTKWKGKTLTMQRIPDMALVMIKLYYFKLSDKLWPFRHFSNEF